MVDTVTVLKKENIMSVKDFKGVATEGSMVDPFNWVVTTKEVNNNELSVYGATRQ